MFRTSVSLYCTVRIPLEWTSATALFYVGEANQGPPDDLPPLCVEVCDEVKRVALSLNVPGSPSVFLRFNNLDEMFNSANTRNRFLHLVQQIVNCYDEIV